MKIVIVGSGGRLGAALAREWSAAGDSVTGFNHAALNLADLDALRQTLQPLEFGALINCAALTNVDYCESNQEEAYQINAKAVGCLAEVCKAKGARLIHISTDYVFDGEKSGAYTEEDPAIPISVYGASKRAGEEEMLRVSDENLAVRVSWVFGPDRASFIDQILSRASQTLELRAIADKIAVPTYTLDVARWLRPLVDKNRIGGLLHMANEGECSWQEYGQYAIECACREGVAFKGREVAPLRMAELTAFVAKRPRNSVLSTQRLSTVSGMTPRPWREAVEEYVRQYWVPSYLNSRTQELR